MTPEQFCYWLQGFAELSGEQPTPEQWKSIREHLQTVYRKVTPEVTRWGDGGGAAPNQPFYSPQIIC